MTEQDCHLGSPCDSRAMRPQRRYKAAGRMFCILAPMMLPAAVHCKMDTTMQSRRIGAVSSQRLEVQGRAVGQVRRVSLARRVDSSEMEAFDTDSHRWQGRDGDQDFSAISRRGSALYSNRISLGANGGQERISSAYASRLTTAIPAPIFHHRSGSNSVLNDGDEYTFNAPSIETARWGTGFGYGSGFSSHSDWSVNSDGMREDSMPREGASRSGMESLHYVVALDGAGSQDFPLISDEDASLAPSATQAEAEQAHGADADTERYTLRVRAPTASGNIVQVFSTVRGLHAAGRISERVSCLLREHGIAVQDGGFAVDEVEKEGEQRALESEEEERLANLLTTRMIAMLPSSEDGAAPHVHADSGGGKEGGAAERQGRPGRRSVGVSAFQERFGRRPSPHGAMYRLRREPAMLSKRGRDE